MGVGKIAGAAVRAGWWAVALATLAAPAVAAARDAVRPARVLHFESLRPLPAASGAARKAGANTLQQLRFDAYGRRFEISLAPNGRLMEQVRAKPGSALQLYRGAIDAVPGSWVRLADKGGVLQGMIWDGVELYVVEPASAVLDSLDAALPADASATVLFRLADAVIDPAATACGTESTPASRKASEAYGALLHELKSGRAAMQAMGAARRLDLSVLGDSTFNQRYDSELDARDALLTRLNNVDGIFSSQLAVEIRVGNLSVHDVSDDPLSGATAPNTLLRELARLRKRSPELHAEGLTHLFTSRDLDGTTIGIAYLDTLCATEHGVGLTESRNVWLDSLVSAHEIGHNFGADHDGDSQGSCAGTPSSGYLMGPIVSGSDDFSQCSLDRMRASAQTASCITNLPPANVSIPANLGSVRRAVSASFRWELRVSNAGGMSARNVRAQLTVPGALMIEDANVVGGSCMSGAGTVECQLGDIPGSSARVVYLDLRSDLIGSSTVTAHVAADNNASTSDDDGAGLIDIERQADVSLTMQGPAAAAAREAFTVSFHVANATAESADNVKVTIAVPAGTSVNSAALADGRCSTGGGRIECMVAPLGAGLTTDGSISLTRSTAGTVALHAVVSGDYVDPNSANDSADLIVAIGAATSLQSAEPHAASQSGGGGSVGLLLLLALTPLARLRQP